MPFFNELKLNFIFIIITVGLASALPKYRHIGCFSDRRDRAVPKYIGQFRDDPLLICYEKAKTKDYKVFAVQNNGECWSGPEAHTTYDKYGQSGACRNNLGGGWANDVYLVNAYVHVGCYKDNRLRSMGHSLGGTHGEDAVHKCYELAAAKGYHAFALQNGGECWSSEEADINYNMHGLATNCKDGKGGGWSNDVYFIHDFSPMYKRQGCYRDERDRAMGSLQGSRKNRNDSIERCYQDAVKGGFTMFGLQHGGECWSGDKLKKTYSKHGEADNCKDGLGGVWSNDVYSINFYRKGCYKDDSPRTMGVFLGSFTGPNAVLRCYQLVKDRKHSAFGVQNGGDCYTSYDAMAVYDKYGAGSDCKDGKGGPSSNDVYFINRFDKNDKLYPREGCFKDKRDRALPVYLGYFHKNAVNSCFRAALAKDWRFFGIQNGGECWSGPNVIATFSKHGAGTKCHNGLGGVWNTDVYRIAFQHKDCYVDDPLRALPDVLGIWRKVSPSVILAKCFEAAKAKGLKVFGIQYDGECYSSPNGLSTYKKYGPGTGCTDGVGENWVNDVYSVDSTSQYTSLGCWKDRPWRRFELLGTWKEDVYRKCYEAVTARGWKGFGIQYGGECWSNKDIETLYNVRGKSTDCKDGRGGEWANNIYLV